MYLNFENKGSYPQPVRIRSFVPQYNNRAPDIPFIVIYFFPLFLASMLNVA